VLVVTTTAKDVLVTPRCLTHGAALMGDPILDHGEVILDSCKCPDSEEGNCFPRWYMEITYHRSETASVRMSFEEM
jgi:hypothetical protein